MALESLESRRGFSPKGALSAAGIALAAALFSLVCFRTGYFFFLFPLPLALAVLFGESRTAWAAGILTITLNILVLLWFAVYEETPLLLLQWNALYYTVMVMAFTWINAPLGRFWAAREIPYRMIAAAFVSAVFLVPLLVSMVQNPEFKSIVTSQMEALGSIATSGISGGPTTDELLSGIVHIGLRGGVLLSCLFFWWLNRQLAQILYRLIRRERGNQTVAILGFRAPFFLVWVLSCSLGTVLIGTIWNIELMEIAGWNILVLSAILFLVQGFAVSLYFLAKLPPMFRIFVNIGIVILILQPGINAAILGVLVLLGIAENWVPFRAPKQ